MTVRYSAGLAKSLMNGGGDFATIFTNCSILIMSGTQPVSANDALTGTILARVTESGLAFTHGAPQGGLNWGTPYISGSVAYMDKASGEDWRYTGLAAGVARWGRLVGNPLDDGSSSTTLPRIDFSIGRTSGILLLTDTDIAVSEPGTIVSAKLSLPLT